MGLVWIWSLVYWFNFEMVYQLHRTIRFNWYLKALDLVILFPCNFPFGISCCVEGKCCNTKLAFNFFVYFPSHRWCMNCEDAKCFDNNSLINSCVNKVHMRPKLEYWWIFKIFELESMDLRSVLVCLYVSTDHVQRLSGFFRFLCRGHVVNGKIEQV